MNTLLCPSLVGMNEQDGARHIGSYLFDEVGRRPLRSRTESIQFITAALSFVQDRVFSSSCLHV